MAMKVFPKRLKEARNNKGLTQKEMSLELNIPYDTYLSYEANGVRRREPNIETISKIADILGVSVDFLFGRE